jgi:hypothetical protein
VVAGTANAVDAGSPAGPEGVALAAAVAVAAGVEPAGCAMLTDGPVVTDRASTSNSAVAAKAKVTKRTIILRGVKGLELSFMGMFEGISLLLSILCILCIFLINFDIRLSGMHTHAPARSSHHCTTPCLERATRPFPFLQQGKGQDRGCTRRAHLDYNV